MESLHIKKIQSVVKMGSKITNAIPDWALYLLVWSFYYHEEHSNDKCY